MRQFFTAGFAGLALACPAAAQPPAPVENDLKCVAALLAIAGSMPEGAQRMQMAAGVMYFMGRVEGQAPTLDLKAELQRIVPTLGSSQIEEEARRCGAILIEKGGRLQDIGKALG
ncbi:MAG TPA: hypothetical protein VFF89_02325, partial [Sphingobium sp.]|nr:hypothetical protein [Sphingobium sp.]